MPKGKPVVKQLLNASRAAMFCAIEIHNKPIIEYRYQSTVILVINAWELILKAFLYKFIGKKSIFEKNGHTITLAKALALVESHLNGSGDKSFTAIKANIELLNDYRSSNVHYFVKELDQVVFMLVYKSVLDFNKFAKKHFGMRLTERDNLIILPIGFRLPMDPVKFLTQKYQKKSSNSFVEGLIKQIKDLHASNVDECLLIGIDLNLTSAKKITNADLIAAVDNKNAEVLLAKAVKLTNDQNAPAARVDEKSLYDKFSLRTAGLKSALKAKRPDLKMNWLFNEAMREIKKNPELCFHKVLDARNPNSQSTNMYTPEAVDEVIAYMDRVLNNENARQQN